MELDCYCEKDYICIYMCVCVKQSAVHAHFTPTSSIWHCWWKQYGTKEGCIFSNTVRTRSLQTNYHWSFSLYGKWLVQCEPQKRVLTKTSTSRIKKSSTIAFAIDTTRDGNWAGLGRNSLYRPYPLPAFLP